MLTLAKLADFNATDAMEEPTPSARRSPGRPILRMERVSKSFHKQQILKSLNLEIAEGEFLTLLGPSGCGKTTSLNLVAGLLQADEGSIFLRGVLANDLPPQRRRLGMVFQSWALFPHMTVFDNIAYGLKMKSAPATDIRRKVGEMLDLVHLPEAAAKFPSQLSGGMQQRVALARALVTEPDLLLLDEPLSNLDAALRKEMQIELKRIHERLRVTTLLVTHSQEEALVMSDRIAVMRSGRIEQIDAPQTIYTRPRNAFVCRFLGDANILEGVIERTGPNAQARVNGQALSLPDQPSWGAGERVRVAVRPESITISAPGAAVGDNVWDAEVIDRIFQGNSVSYELRAGDQAVIALGLPMVGGPMLARGDRASLSFSRHAVMPLDLDAASDD